MKETHVGEELALLRKGKLNQADIAKAMGVDQSRVSRIEGDPKPDTEDVQKFLMALDGDPDVKEFREYVEAEWPNLGKLGKPVYRHPYRHELRMAETALGKLQKFISAPSNPPDLVQQAKQYEASLREVATFLHDLKHNFAFVGNVAVGKTTALCYVADLLIREATTQKQKMALDTGAGYTTQGEVRVSSLASGMEGSGKFGIVIYPHPKEEVFRLANDICASALAMRDGKENESRVPEEVEKVLRVMAGLPRTEREGELYDPLLDLANENPEKLTAEFQSRMNLGERTTTSLWLDATNTQEGLIWLRDEFRKINSGRNAKVSLAKRIDIFVPMPLLPATPFEISPIDTKGAEETAVRPDLQAHYDDPRSITILCSHFAPDSTMVDVLAHLAATGKSSTISERVVFMVLAREKETLTMNSEDGSPIEDVKQAYVLREALIRSKLSKYPGGKNVPIIFYDSVEEDAAPVREKLLHKVTALRAIHATRLKDIATATDDLVSTFQNQQAKRGFKKLRAELRQFVETYRELPVRTMPVQSQLLSALKNRHPRTVWASTTRNGDFYNLDSYERVATAANMDAKNRSDGAIAALNALLDQLLKDPECTAIVSHIAVLQKDVAAWHLKFLDELKNRSQEIFRAVLFPDNGVWGDCKSFWGKGLGFRDNVATTVQEWIKLPAHDWMEEAVEGLVRKDWQDFFIAPIKEQAKEPPVTS